MKERRVVRKLAPHKPEDDSAADTITTSTEKNVIGVALSPPKKAVTKPSKRPQLTVFVDTEAEEEDDDRDAGGGQQVMEAIRTPRVQGRISPGAVHVGKFAINEQGLRSEMTACVPDSRQI